jgi:hypothetical protein
VLPERLDDLRAVAGLAHHHPCLRALVLGRASGAECDVPPRPSHFPSLRRPSYNGPGRMARPGDGGEP